MENSLITIDQVTFGWNGADSDGSVIGYYYSFDHDPPNIWTTETTIISDILSEGNHFFKIVAVDDSYELSATETRNFSVNTSSYIVADFTASTTSGTAPFSVQFTDTSVAANGITYWVWDFGDGGSASIQNPVHSYLYAGVYSINLTVFGPDGNDSKLKTDYIIVISTTDTPDAQELDVFELVNQERIIAGVAELEWHAGLFNIAWAHSNDMCDRGFFSHINPEGEDATARGLAGHAGSYAFPPIVPEPFSVIGENIAMGYSSATSLMEAWMNSPGHRANILNSSYTHIAVGRCNGCNEHWTQCFSTWSGNLTFRFEPSEVTKYPNNIVAFYLVNGVPPFQFGYEFPGDIQSYDNPAAMQYTFNQFTGEGSYTVGPNDNCTDMLYAEDADGNSCHMTITVIPSGGKG